MASITDLMRIVLVLAAVVLLEAVAVAGALHEDVVAAFYPLAYVAQTVGRAVASRVGSPTPLEPSHTTSSSRPRTCRVQRAASSSTSRTDSSRGPGGGHGTPPETPVDVLQPGRAASRRRRRRGPGQPARLARPGPLLAIVRRVGAALRTAASGPPRWPRARGARPGVPVGVADLRPSRLRHEPCRVRIPRRALRPAPGPDQGIDQRRSPARGSSRSSSTSSGGERATTVFFERLVSPEARGDGRARDAGAKTAVLDPIEGLTDARRRAARPTSR